MNGLGKYDLECTQVAELLNAQSVVLIIVGGSKGNGFSVQTKSFDFAARLPTLLRMMMADDIEEHP